VSTETKWASSHITGGCSTPANAVGATDGVWTTDTGNVNWTSRWAMEDPSGPITGTQQITVLVRKESAGGNDPTLNSVTLFENGASVAQLSAGGSVTSATGQTFSGNFDGSAITNPDDVEIQIATTGAGGPVANRRAVQVDSIEWTVALGSPSNEYDYTGSGGMNFGGSAPRSFVAAIVASGGMLLGGAAPVSASVAVEGSGGLTFGGAAVTSFVEGGGATEPNVYDYDGSGGILFGGSAPVSVERSEAGSGGASFAGSAPVAFSVSVDGSGGATFGGSAAMSRTASVEGSGGIGFGGTAGVLAEWSPVASGGITFGGAADVSASGTQSYSYTGSGGLELGGSAGIAAELHVTGSGGLSIGGSADESTGRNVTGTGGMSFGGAADHSASWSAAGTGGIVFGGEAETSTETGPQTYDYTGFGGIVFNGAASTSFTAAQPPEITPRLLTAKSRRLTLADHSRTLLISVRPRTLILERTGMKNYDIHHPLDKAPYGFRFRDPDGATVVSISSITILKINDVDDAPSPLGLTGDPHLIAGDTAAVWIEGGVLGAHYKLSITILDTKGRNLTESGFILVGHR
jgi:hypothetical protein